MTGKPQTKRKIRRPKNAESPEPRVGILYLVGRKLLVDSTPLAQAAMHGDNFIHDLDHISY